MHLITNDPLASKITKIGDTHNRISACAGVFRQESQGYAQGPALCVCMHQVLYSSLLLLFVFYV